MYEARVHKYHGSFWLGGTKENKILPYEGLKQIANWKIGVVRPVGASSETLDVSGNVGKLKVGNASRFNRQSVAFFQMLQQRARLRQKTVVYEKLRHFEKYFPLVRREDAPLGIEAGKNRYGQLSSFLCLGLSTYVISSLPYPI